MNAIRTLAGCLLVIAITFISSDSLVVAAEGDANDRAVENLAAFAKLYGYVRFFHPSDEAADMDWNKFAVVSVEAVRDARDDAALRDALRQLFETVAPSLRVLSREELSNAAYAAPWLPVGERFTFWQHNGVYLSERSNIYRSRRVIAGEEAGERAAIFRPVIPPPAVLETFIAPEIVIRLPLVLRVTADNRTQAGKPADLDALKVRLAAVDQKASWSERWSLRVAGAIVAWSTFQHFHPYIDRIGVKWDDVLRPALRRSLVAKDVDDYYESIAGLVAELQDGHGVFYFNARQRGGLPIRAELIEGQVVVTGAKDDSPFRKGDLIKEIDGTAAVDILHNQEKLISGSPQLRTYRTLNQFGQGPIDSTAHIAVLRNDVREEFDCQRPADRRSLFFNPIKEFDFPTFAEVRPSIFYVNLKTMEPADFEQKLPQLATAKGVIFDQRWDGRAGPTNSITAHKHIIPHLIDKPVQASPMLMPQITQPDRIGWAYSEQTWPVAPQAPRLKGCVVFINEPSVVSYGETTMAMIAHYGLAKLVGAATAGCNGNANYILLPNGFQIMWTGMEVLKHDRSQLYLTGFVPDFPVVRTMLAVKEGRDEYLEKAIEVVGKSAMAANP